jgi:hypothetical protein
VSPLLLAGYGGQAGVRNIDWQLVIGYSIARVIGFNHSSSDGWSLMPPLNKTITSFLPNFYHQCQANFYKSIVNYYQGKIARKRHNINYQGKMI